MKICGIIIAFVGMCLAIIGANGGFPEYQEVILKITRFALVMFLALLILNVVIIVIIYMKARTVDYIGKRRQLFIGRCMDADLDTVSEMAADVFGDRATSHEQTRHLYEIDREIFCLIKDKNQVIQGYYCIFRINKDCIDAIHQFRFDIKSMPLSYINKSKKKKYADYYIGALCGKSVSAKAHALGALESYIIEQKARRVYARAATGDGMRILIRHEFKPVGQHPPSIGDIMWRDNHR